MASRRVLRMVGLGCALALAQVLGPSVVQAFGVIESEEEKAKCLAEGGRLLEREMFGLPGTGPLTIVACDTPEKDAECEAKHGKDFHYDYLTGKCTDVPPL